MKPLKLVIPGSYYDSQLYEGRLYLWQTDNSIRIFDWNKLINLVKEKMDEPLRIALACGFLRSDYLYGSKWDLIFNDVQIKAIITSKFENLSQKNIEISEDDLMKAEIKHQENPLKFLHTDSLIYRRKLYISGRNGVFEMNCGKKNVNPVSSRVYKKWDAPILSMAASYGALALSAGPEGLYEYDLNISGSDTIFGSTEAARNNPKCISTMHSSFVNYTFYSIFSSSHYNQGYLVDYSKKTYQSEEDNTIHTERNFNKIIKSEDIFSEEAFSWGIQDKLCQIKDGHIEVAKYSPWNKEKEDRIKNLGYFELQNYKGQFVSSNSAVYGFIVEFDNGITVLDSQLGNVWIEGEPVNWRVFPNSKFYENHLHIMYDDYLSIYSFNHDYFLNQKEKKIGLEVFTRN